MSASAAWNKDANSNWSWTENGQKTTGWKMIHGNWYYFDGSGVMQTGWKFINGQWYYMDQSGAMKTGWQFINGEWYHLSASGAMTKGWYKEGSSWYHLNENSVMSRHWRKISNKWYHFNPSGQMSVGWINWKRTITISAAKTALCRPVWYRSTTKFITLMKLPANCRQAVSKSATLHIPLEKMVLLLVPCCLKQKSHLMPTAMKDSWRRYQRWRYYDSSRPSGSGGGGGGGGSSYVEVQSVSLSKTSHIMYTGEDFFF